MSQKMLFCLIFYFLYSTDYKNKAESFFQKLINTFGARRRISMSAKTMHRVQNNINLRLHGKICRLSAESNFVSITGIDFSICILLTLSGPIFGSLRF